jgi:hypothetical protein
MMIPGRSPCSISRLKAQAVVADITSKPRLPRQGLVT